LPILILIDNECEISNGMALQL